MLNLSELLKSKNIQLSIGVYPWPSTLKNDIENNKQVKLWKEFCNINCQHFYNFMPLFFSELNDSEFLKVYKKFYIKNDIHFNVYGHKIISDFFINNYKG